MGLEEVKEEIISSAKQQEESLLAEAREQAKKITARAEKEISGIKENSNAEIKRMADIIKKQELASAELESKKMLLEAKKQLIESVFSDARKKISGLGAKTREEHMKKLLEKAQNDIEVAKVYCSKKDMHIIKEFDTEAIEMLGGIIAENKDGTVRVDYSFDTMLQGIKENKLQNISRILFG
jgi:V/A-type H+-transporting ATPase subunit E